MINNYEYEQKENELFSNKDLKENNTKILFISI